MSTLSVYWYSNFNWNGDEMYERREDRINGLAKINNAKNYLEIGVSKGVTFKEVEITNKVCLLYTSDAADE